MLSFERTPEPVSMHVGCVLLTFLSFLNDDVVQDRPLQTSIVQSVGIVDECVYALVGPFARAHIKLHDLGSDIVEYDSLHVAIKIVLVPTKGQTGL